MKKQLAANILFGKTCLLEKCLNSFRQTKKLLVLAYHRVYEPPENYLFNDEVISASPEDFDKQMSFISNHFNVLSPKKLDSMLTSGIPVPSNSMIITFDDGYYDNYDIVLPILKKYGLTAVFFIATHNSDNGSIYWFEKFIYNMKKYSVNNLTDNNVKSAFKINGNNSKEIRRYLSNLLSTLPFNDFKKLLLDISNKLNTNISDEEFELVKPLPWEKIEEMSNEGMEIGSHTVNHPFLASLTDEEIFYELSESKRIIEKHINKDVSSISYPNGGPYHYDDRVLSIAEQCGYSFGFSYTNSTSVLTPQIKYKIPRIHIEKELSLPLFKALLLLPDLFIRTHS